MTTIDTPAGRAMASKLTPLLAPLLLVACGASPQSPTARPGTPVAAASTTAPALAAGTPERVYAEPVHRWFEDAFLRASVSADGRWLVMPSAAGTSVLSLATLQKNDARARGPLDEVQAVVPCGPDLLRAGKRAGVTGLFREDGTKLDVPERARIACSSDGGAVALIASGALEIGPWSSRRRVALGGEPTAAALSLAGDVAYALVWHPAGDSSLVAVDVARGGVTELAKGLDASQMRTAMSVSPDGGRLYLSLVGTTAPPAEVRQRAFAGRWLDLYALTIATRELHAVVRSAADKLAPQEVDGRLYWSQSVKRRQIVALPSAGGPAHVVADDGEVPSWSPDGTQVGFVTGEWRLADWALSTEGASVPVDAAARPRGASAIVVSGNHEDFEPEWSPDGAWIAFHSHRAPVPVSSYDDPRATDDIWLRRAQDPPTAGSRLTDFGLEAGSPWWSPDGRTLAFSSWKRGETPHRGHAYLVTLDAVTGQRTATREIVLPGANDVSWAAWSSVKGDLALETWDSSTQHSVWTVRPDGSEATRVASFPSDTFSGIDWTRDGGALLYAALDGGRSRIFTVPRSGGAGRPLSDAAEAGSLRHPRTSPDGKWVACTRTEGALEVWRVSLR